MKITPREKMEELKEEFNLVFPCINKDCGGDGIIPERDCEGDWQPSQCEYCYKIRFLAWEWVKGAITQRKKEYAEGLIGEIKKAMDEKIKEFAINNASGRESYVGITLRIVFTIDDKISQIKKREGMG